MTQRSPERERLDAAGRQWGVLPGSTTLPYLAGYLVMVMATSGSPELANGLFIVTFAVLLVGSSVGGWRSPHPARVTQVAVGLGAGVLGLAVGFLVGHVGVA
ncbi:hypothetical protein GCM10023340_02290 [Nocardioides marinquilinus]|uniref:VIT family protein n=1 Tax=Nocardioides marinquilinus TaxID=1210400 RepID=A0ABP9P5G8_9ACTN